MGEAGAFNCVLGAVLALGAWGCETSRAPEPSPSGIGAAQCGVDADCTATCDYIVEQLQAPGYVPTSASTRCDLVGFAGGGAMAPSCECVNEGGGTLVLSSASPGPCLYFGRDRTCLYGRAEFAGCDMADAGSCEAPCADFHDRIAADAVRPVDAEVRHTGCHELSCECVVRIGDGCYVNQELARNDCTLSDAAILETYRMRSTEYPPCSEVDMSMGTVGTCFDDTP